MVHAAAGHVNATLELIEKCVTLGYRPDQFYGDADVGRILATDRFEKVRRRFPPGFDAAPVNLRGTADASPSARP